MISKVEKLQKLMQTYLEMTTSKAAMMRESPEEIIRVQGEIEEAMGKVRGRATHYESVMTDIETHMTIIKGLQVICKKSKKKIMLN